MRSPPSTPSRWRRTKETVGDLDILTTAGRAATAIDRFTAYDEVTDVRSRGPTCSTARFRTGLRMDLPGHDAMRHGEEKQQQRIGEKSGWEPG